MSDKKPLPTSAIVSLVASVQVERPGARVFTTAFLFPPEYTKNGPVTDKGREKFRTGCDEMILKLEHAIDLLRQIRDGHALPDDVLELSGESPSAREGG